MGIFKKAWEWTMRANWRTWLSHAVLAALLAGLFHATLGVMQPSFAAFLFYFMREVEQIFVTWCEGRPQDWADHALDVSAAFIAAGLTNAYLGW
jgi:hypothetical protein